MQRIGQNKASFCVCIQDFDGLPAHAGDDIAGALGIAIGHVFNQPHHAHDIRLGLALHQRQHTASDRSCAAHIPFHVFHAGSGLDRDTACIECDTLAHKRDRCRARFAAIPADGKDTRFAHRTLPHAQKRAHAERFHCGFVQNDDLCPGSGKAFAAAFDEAFRIDDIGRFRHQFTGQLHTIGQRLRIGQHLLRIAWRADNNDPVQRNLLFILHPRAINIITPVAQAQTQQDMRHILRRESRPGQIEHQFIIPAGLELARQCGTGSLHIGQPRIVSRIACTDKRKMHHRITLLNKGIEQLAWPTFETGDLCPGADCGRKIGGKLALLHSLGNETRRLWAGLAKLDLHEFSRNLEWLRGRANWQRPADDDCD